MNIFESFKSYNFSNEEINTIVPLDIHMSVVDLQHAVVKGRIDKETLFNLFQNGEIKLSLDSVPTKKLNRILHSYHSYAENHDMTNIHPVEGGCYLLLNLVVGRQGLLLETTMSFSKEE